jgi:hypothetical protein
MTKAVFACSLLLLTAALLAGAEETLRSGVWTAEYKDGEFNLSLAASSDRTSWGGGWMASFHGSLNSLEGLSVAAMSAATGQAVHFTVTREEGTIRFDGQFEQGEGAGHFHFEPKAEYVAEMGKLGFTDLRSSDLLLFTLNDVSTARVRALKSLGLELTAHDLVNAAVFDITPQTIHAFEVAGYRGLTMHELVNLRVGQITPASIAEYRSLGLGDLSAHDLANLGILGATPAYIREMQRTGLQELNARDLHQLRAGDIAPSDVARYRAAGYPSLTAKDLAQFGIHHITVERIAEYRQLGYTDLEPRELIQLTVMGVTPSYIRDLKAKGITNATPRQLIRMKSSGVDQILIKGR